MVLVGHGFESHWGQRVFSLSPCWPISFLGLMLRRYLIFGISVQHFNSPNLNHYNYIHFKFTNSLTPDDFHSLSHNTKFHFRVFYTSICI